MNHPKTSKIGGLRQAINRATIPSYSYGFRMSRHVRTVNPEKLRSIAYTLYKPKRKI